MVQGIKKITDFEVQGKRILVRVDLNVPIAHGKIVDTSRIERIIPTIKHLSEAGAKVILLSHFGRPKGKFVLKMSLASIVDAINKFLPENNSAKFCVDCRGTKPLEAISQLKDGEILLLENLRFYKEEEEGDQEFAQELASFGDIFINDTFSCSHRNHSSITGITKYLPSAMGLLFASEIENIEKNLSSPKAPFAALVGGSKISTKLDLLYTLVQKSDYLIIGGGMANTFLKAQGVEIGKSLCEDSLIDKALEIMNIAKEHNCEIILPLDIVIASKLMDADDLEILDIEDKINPEKMILDLGPKTTAYISTKLELCKTIVWNGPLGAFEFKPFNIATESVARTVANLTRKGEIISVAGGGDVVAALNSGGLSDTFTYLSTAGGAFLEWLEGKDIPGLCALKK